MTTILSIAQTCAERLMLPVPTSFVTSTSNNMVLLRAMINKAVEEIKDEYPWVELQKEYTFALATDVDSYALPADLDKRLNDTLWNRNDNRLLAGPLDASEWQNYKSGLIATFPGQRHRVKGWGIKQLFIDPVPSASENGQICAYEYISSSTWKPKAWTASTSWAGIRYCSYNGYIFDRGTTGAGTTGTTAPTPSALDDGGITWTLHTAAYNIPQHDTDESILNDNMIKDGATWRFKAERGFDYLLLKEQAEQQITAEKTKLQGATVVSFNQRRVMGIGEWSYPEGNFGI